jgi:methionine synthase I (cobalamin-dependent)
MIKNDLKHLMRNRVVLMDGAMGSMIIAAGLREGEIPESWMLRRLFRRIRSARTGSNSNLPRRAGG